LKGSKAPKAYRNHVDNTAIRLCTAAVCVHNLPLLPIFQESRLSTPKIKVLCVDDSALIRNLLQEIIDAEPDMEVVAVAPDPLIARDLIKQHNPDVLTLDVEMPRMDGLDFLERLMRLRPM